MTLPKRNRSKVQWIITARTYHGAIARLSCGHFQYIGGNPYPHTVICIECGTGIHPHWTQTCNPHLIYSRVRKA